MTFAIPYHFHIIFTFFFKVIIYFPFIFFIFIICILLFCIKAFILSFISFLLFSFWLNIIISLSFSSIFNIQIIIFLSIWFFSFIFPKISLKYIPKFFLLFFSYPLFNPIIQRLSIKIIGPPFVLKLWKNNFLYFSFPIYSIIPYENSIIFFPIDGITIPLLLYSLLL